MSDKKEVAVKKSVTDLAFPEISKIQLTDSFNKLVEIMPEHGQMLEVIKESIPEVHRATSLFYKTQSQFMDNMMTVSHNTPLRNLRQILAQMNKTRDAIKEAHHNLKEKEVELEELALEAQILEKRIKNRNVIDVSGGKKWKLFGSKDKNEDSDLENQLDETKLKKIRGKMDKIVDNAESTRGYISGAIRQLTNYTNQYNNIKESYGIGEFSEEDFENEEERYHIMKAFEQGLCAARSRGGLIDEGNMIYFTQIGVNGAMAQFRVTEFLVQEQESLKSGKAPTHKDYLDFLDRMADEFAGSAEKYADLKGMNTMSSIALIHKGDNRMLLADQKKEEPSEDSKE